MVLWPLREKEKIQQKRISNSERFNIQPKLNKIWITLQKKIESMTIIEHFKNFIEEKTLFKKEDKILLGVSGGMDSIVMAELFHQAKFKFDIAHVNFGLRGEESKADEEFVRSLAKKYKVEFHHTQFETAAFAEKEGISIQMAARNLRYAWFESIREKYAYQKIAIAHHQTDSAETILLNLVRGTMLSGLHGILPKNGHIIRPIIWMNKEEMMEILEQNRLAWREDSSNASTKYKRNFIRHEIYPLLKELNPNFEETISKNAEKILKIEDWLNQELEAWKSNYIRVEKEGLWINPPENFDIKNQLLFSQFLNEIGFNSQQIEQILAIDRGATGKIFESPIYTININRGEYVLVRKSLEEFSAIFIEEGTKEIFIGENKLTFELADYSEKLELNQGNNTAILDYDLVQWPLVFRSASEGDWFCPLGMNKKKLISDFLTDKKIPFVLKKSTKILVSGHSICWVVGHRIDNRYKVGEKTKKVLIIQI